MAEATTSKRYEIEKEAADKSRADAKEKLSKGKPTPTQEENDRLAMGEHVELADDGSGEDPYPSAQATYNKQMEGGGKGGYKTRDSTAATHAAPAKEK
jgi:hypothetical protein